MNIFHPDSKFSHIMGTVFDHVKLGILFLVFSLPVVTAGAAATAAMFVGMKIARGEAPEIFRPFWQSFRQNFKQATVITLMLLALAALLGFDWYQLFSMESTLPVRIARGVTFLAAMMVLFVTMYIFPVLARFQVTTRQLLRNAVTFGILNFAKNLLVAAVLLGGLWLLDNVTVLLPITVVALPAVLIWMLSGICAKSFEKVEVQNGKDDL